MQENQDRLLAAANVPLSRKGKMRMSKYCVSISNIFFKVDARNEEEVKYKALRETIKQIIDSMIEIWPDYDGDECHRKYEHISEEDLKNINCTVG